VILLMEPGRDREGESPYQPRRLVVRAMSPSLNERVDLHAIDVDQHTLEQLQALKEAQPHTPGGQSAGLHSAMLERLNPLPDSQYRALLSAPLIAATEHLGLLNCYFSKAHRFTPEDQTLLTTIANQAAIAIKNSYLVNQLAQKNLVKGFFDDLMHGTSDSDESLRQRAHFLGYDLTRPHAVVMLETAYTGESGNEGALAGRAGKGEREYTSEESGSAAWGTGNDRGISLQTAYKRIGTLVRRRILDTYPSSIFYERENLLTCIVPLNKDLSGTRLKSWLQDMAHQLRSEYSVCLSVGIGNACQHIGDYRRGFAEASEALQMGQALQQDKWNESRFQPVVTHFNDLGVYRYLYKIAHMDDLRDVYQDQIARIDSYDRRKNTDLLDTLETYLECAGNLTRTSDRLFVHRNTLIQRLERLQSLCDIDLQDRGNWLTLQIAIKVFKLRTGSA
jgi:sugar diacid utilization regulator